ADRAGGRGGGGQAVVARGPDALAEIPIPSPCEAGRGLGEGPPPAPPAPVSRAVCGRVPGRMSTFWQDKSVVVTGGAGSLGSCVVDRLQRAGARVVSPRSREYDLVDRGAVRRLLADAQPQMVIHLAARVGGIGANQDNPGRYLFENAMMGLQLFEECRL